MPRRLRFLVLVALALAAAGCRGGTSRHPPIHLNPNMDNQVRMNPQAESDFFADGRAMRAPVAGTVKAGTYSSDTHLMLGMKDGQPATSLPPSIALDATLLSRGQERFGIYCSPCHDSSGGGNGTVVLRGMMAPPSFHDDRLRAQGVGYFYQTITNGIRNMPSYAGQIPLNDRWAIAAYVRVLQRSQDATLDQVPADVAAAKGWKP